MSDISLERAVEVFVHAFCRVKSRFHPYLAERVEGLWVMRDGPGRKEPRKVEVIANEMEPAEVVAGVGRAELGWHFLCDIRADDSSQEAIKAEYKRLGYRKVSTEWLFTHDLLEIPAFESEPPARLITEMPAVVPPRTTYREFPQIRSDARLYCSWTDHEVFGSVYSVPFGKDSWVSDLFVYQQFRRSGYGRALMSRLLQDDRDLGIAHSALLSSAAGKNLYPVMGYEKRATLQMFCPLKR